MIHTIGAKPAHLLQRRHTRLTLNRLTVVKPSTFVRPLAARVQALVKSGSEGCVAHPRGGQIYKKRATRLGGY